MLPQVSRAASEPRVPTPSANPKRRVRGGVRPEASAPSLLQQAAPSRKSKKLRAVVRLFKACAWDAVRRRAAAVA